MKTATIVKQRDKSAAAGGKAKARWPRPVFDRRADRKKCPYHGISPEDCGCIC